MTRRKIFNILLLAFFPVMVGTMVSCSENDDTWDPYQNWAERNAQWYATITDSARTAIAQAKAQYGDQWEDHCEWRRYKTLLKSQSYDTGLYTDSICVHIIKRGTRGEGVVSPVWTDTVRLDFRGWLMPSTYRLYNDNNVEVDSVMQEVFSQSYYGVFDEHTAAPQLMALGSTVEGFSTALQYMVPGDDWLVYVPSNMAYGSTANDAIPAYSTLLFRLYLVAVYPTNSGIPDWK